MPAPAVADNPKKIKLGLYGSQEEVAALEFIYKTNRHKYPDGRTGIASVLRDYSLTDALEFYRRAKAELRVS